jgi:hypothetical protein
VMVTIRFDGDADDLFDKWERAAGFGRRNSRPVLLPRSSRRESTEDFSSSTSSQAMRHIRTSGATLAARWKQLDFSNPQLEHLDVLKSAPATDPE